MMQWQCGEHKCDGPWAAWWYHDVHQTSGWVVQQTQQQSSQQQSVKSGSSTTTTTTTSSSSNYNVHKSRRRYRTLDPTLMSALRASYPAYQFLVTLTRGYKNRGPPPAKIYEDPRNEHLLAYVGARGQTGGCLVPREMAAVSPWDSSVQGGDAAWEGLRVYRGKVFHFDQHLNRLFRSAKALGFNNIFVANDCVVEVKGKTKAKKFITYRLSI